MVVVKMNKVRDLEVQANEVVTHTVKVRKLRTWVKVAMGAVVGTVLTTGIIFGTEKVDYVDVQVSNGDTVCSLIESVNGEGSCADYKKDVYELNGIFSGKVRSINDIHTGDVLTIPVVSKRFVK